VIISSSTILPSRPHHLELNWRAFAYRTASPIEGALILTSNHKFLQKMEAGDGCRTALPPSLVEEMKQVLVTLKVGGECPIHWRDFSSRFRSITRTELDPAKYQYRSAQEMLEYMAECGECEMVYVKDKGVCVTTKKRVCNEDMDMDLTMLDLPWTETGILPVGAVEDQDLAQQVLDVYEGGSVSVQVTEVVSLDKIWVCPLSMVDERE